MFEKFKALVSKLRSDPPGDEETQEELPPPENDETRISKVVQVSQNTEAAYQPQFHRKRVRNG
jgi:hypothetical protein